MPDAIEGLNSNFQIEEEETTEFKKLKEPQLKTKYHSNKDLFVIPAEKRAGKTASGFKYNFDEKAKQVGKRRTNKMLFNIVEHSTSLGGTIEEEEPILEEELTQEQEDLIKDILQQLELYEGLDEETM